MTPVTRAPSGHSGRYTTAQVAAMAADMVAVANRAERLYGKRVAPLHERKREADEAVAAASGAISLARFHGRPVTTDMRLSLARARGDARSATRRLAAEQAALRPLVDAEVRGITTSPDRVLATIIAETERDARASRRGGTARRERAHGEWLASFDARTSTAQALWQLQRLRGAPDRPVVTKR